MTYREALLKCARRYEEMAAPNFELSEFVKLFKKGVEDGLPIMKMNRWLGYIQGMLICDGATSVTAERDWTRPLFRPLDFPENNP